MRKLQGQPEKSISEFWIIGDIEDLMNYSCRIAAMQNSPTAALHDQHYDHYIPDELHQEEGKELIGLKDIQSFGIQNGLQNVKVIKENEQKGYGYDSEQRICKVFLDGLANVAEQIVYVGHLFDCVFRIEAYDGGNTVPLHGRANQIS